MLFRSYLLTQAKALVLYVRLALWPHPLVVDYGTSVVTSLGEVVVPGLLVLTALGATAWALVRRPAVGFLGAWFFVILAPSSSVVPLATQTMAEHRMYLPLAAIVVALALLMRRLGARTAAIAGAGLVALWGGLTVWRNHDYRSSVAIWEQTVRYQPNNERAHNNLGQALYQAGRLAEAVPELQAALAMDDTGGKDPFRNLTVFHSLSKRSNAAGLRSGFVAGDPKLVAMVLRWRTYGGPQIPIAVQKASVALWNEETHPIQTRDWYRRNFKVAEQILHNRFGYYTPGGGFFLWLDVGNGEEATRKLWRDAHVKVLPGAYACRETDGVNTAERYIRVALVHDEKTTREGLQRLAQVL